MKQELLPCPWCGSAAQQYGQHMFVSCSNMRCDAFGNSFSDAETWNTRAPDTRVQLLAKALMRVRDGLPSGAFEPEVEIIDAALKEAGIE